MTLTAPDSSAALSVSLTDPSQWSDWNGQNGASSASVTAGFNAAVAEVSQIGLSFGGGCFFENGATTRDGSDNFALTGFSSRTEAGRPCFEAIDSPCTAAEPGMASPPCE